MRLTNFGYRAGRLKAGPRKGKLATEARVGLEYASESGAHSDYKRGGITLRRSSDLSRFKRMLAPHGFRLIKGGWIRRPDGEPMDGTQFNRLLALYDQHLGSLWIPYRAKDKQQSKFASKYLKSSRRK